MPTLSRDDATLYYELDGEAGQPAVIYIPGFGSHSNDILAMLIRGFLARAGYRVLVVDNRGCGQTQTPPNAACTIDLMAEDAAAVMDAVGIDQAHILGISMGGCVAMTFALNYPERTKSLVSAISFDGHKRSERTKFMLETMRLLRDADVPQELLNRVNAFYLLGEQVFDDTDLIAQWIAAPADPLRQTRAGYEMQIAAVETYNIADRLHAITAPCLVISSPDDMLVPPRFQRAIAERIPGAQFKEYPGGHAFMMHPQRMPLFIGDLLAFWASAG